MGARLAEPSDDPQKTVHLETDMRDLDRRRFLAGLLAAPVLPPALSAGPRTKHDASAAAGTLDIHVHLVGIGDNGSGCRLSKTVTSGAPFQILSRTLGIRRRAATFDEGYVLALAEFMRDSGPDKCGLLAFDAVYGGNGKPDWRNTHFYVPNDYVFEVAARFPQQIVPCVSVNPDRADAMDELDRCVEKGARGLKLLAPTQGTNLADKRHTRFFRRCAERHVLLIVHSGHEHAVPVLDNKLGHPRKLELALDQGCTVVACHCGTNYPKEYPKTLPEYLKMLREYPNLYGDSAALARFNKLDDFRRLLADDLARRRLVHGSDFPVPCQPWAFTRDVGRLSVFRLRRVRNPMAKDFALKKLLGVGRASAERGYRLLCGSSDEDQRST